MAGSGWCITGIGVWSGMGDDGASSPSPLWSANGATGESGVKGGVKESAGWMGLSAVGLDPCSWVSDVYNTFLT